MYWFFNLFPRAVADRAVRRYFWLFTWLAGLTRGRPPISAALVAMFAVGGLAPRRCLVSSLPGTRCRCAGASPPWIARHAGWAPMASRSPPGSSPRQRFRPPGSGPASRSSRPAGCPAERARAGPHGHPGAGRDGAARRASRRRCHPADHHRACRPGGDARVRLSRRHGERAPLSSRARTARAPPWLSRRLRRHEGIAG